MGLRKLFLFLFLLIGFTSGAQVLQAPNIYGYQFKRVGGDTLVFIPGDTLQVPAIYNSKTFIARKGTTLYYWDGSKWSGIGGGGGSTDTTSLSNRINLKLNISDTAAMLTNYRHWLAGYLKGTDTASLSNRINLKLNISDTAAMLSPYVRSNIYTANGTLTGNRTVNGNNLYSLSVNAAKSVYFNMDYNDGGTPVYGYVDLFPEFMEIFHERNSARHTIAMTPNPAGTTSELKLESRVGSAISSILLYKDSIVLDQADSAINFTRIRSTTDTATFKPLVFGNGGQVRRLTSWPGGTSYTFQNGLRESGGDVRLGNSLIENTTIDGDGLYDLTLNPDTLFVKYQASVGGQTATIRSNGQLGYVIDTVTLAGFGAGSGAAGDTAAFTTDALYGSFYHGHDTLIITSVYAVIQAGATDTLGVQIYFNDSLNTGTTGVLSSTLALTSRPQGHSATSTAVIAPGNWIWAKSPTVVAGRKPEYLSVSLIGYRKRRS